VCCNHVAHIHARIVGGRVEVHGLEMQRLDVELVREDAHVDVVELEELDKLGCHVEEVGALAREQVAAGGHVGRELVVRVVFEGDVPFGEKMAHRRAVVEHVAGVVGGQLRLTHVVAQVVHEGARVQIEVVVNEEIELAVGAVLLDPANAHERLDRVVVIGVVEVLLHDVAVLLVLELELIQQRVVLQVLEGLGVALLLLLLLLELW
jgi:hypothetical protein